jgi:YD repeat-containing protein
VVSPGGILHSSGAGVTFTRDGEGRITKVTDPAGFSTAYAYDAAGDLVSATHSDGHATTYAYSTPRPI